MGKRFDEFIQRKKEIGILYQHTFAGNNICGNCIFEGDAIEVNNEPMTAILQKISEILDGQSPVSEQMTTTVPTARSWNSVSTKKFQDSEVEDELN